MCKVRKQGLICRPFLSQTNKGIGFVKTGALEEKKAALATRKEAERAISLQGKKLNAKLGLCGKEI